MFEIRFSVEKWQVQQVKSHYGGHGSECHNMDMIIYESFCVNGFICRNSHVITACAYKLDSCMYVDSISVNTVTRRAVQVNFNHRLDSRLKQRPEDSDELIMYISVRLAT
jgi:hypothetical protein